MFKITNYTWYVTRGTGKNINLYPKSGTFDKDDDVKFNVYNHGELDKEPVLTKTATISDDGSKATIELSNNDMELGDIQEEKTEYWYEIKCNGSTLIGWDSKGVKKLWLYPEGSKD